MIHISNILDSIELEKKRRKDGLLKPDQHALVLWDRAIKRIQNDAERSKLEKAFIFAKSLSYKHVGLSSEIYFSHPLRVAALSILISGSIKSDVGVLGLIHNVLEVSDLTEKSLTKTFESEMAMYVSTLTVDRTFQWNREYKIDYYRRIKNKASPCRIVKVIDKLDNIFLLCENQDTKVKEMYLDEIEKFVLPMAQQELPNLYDYFKEIVYSYRKA
jgi:(p)ppGpp synthase/HD superfamily hydrolase